MNTHRILHPPNGEYTPFKHPWDIYKKIDQPLGYKASLKKYQFYAITLSDNYVSQKLAAKMEPVKTTTTTKHVWKMKTHF